MTVKRLGFAIVSLALSLFAVVSLSHGLRFGSFEQPPRIGEGVQEVIERLGSPSYDSRTETGQDSYSPRYLLGYTDGLGTRYHLTVELGVVTKIECSSR